MSRFLGPLRWVCPSKGYPCGFGGLSAAAITLQSFPNRWKRLNTALAYRMVRRWACNCLTTKIGSIDISRAFLIEHPGVFTT